MARVGSYTDDHTVRADAIEPRELSLIIDNDRLVFHVFILDVQHSLLHGSDISLSPFILNIQLPESDDSWFAPDLASWSRSQGSINTSPPLFLTILKAFWDSSTIKAAPNTFPRGSKVLMYGILAIAYDLRRRNDNSFSTKSAHNLDVLATKVNKSIATWLSWWEQTNSHPRM